MFWRFTVTFDDALDDYKEKTESGIAHTEDKKFSSIADELYQYYGEELTSIYIEEFAPDNVLIGFTAEEIDRVKARVVW